MTITADSAEAGLEQLPYYVFDVAFIDQYLPGMEGLVFGEYLRRNNPEMAIALITGSPEERLERLCQEHDIQFIPKPFDPDVALTLVEDYRAEQDRLASQWDDEQSPDFAPDIASHVAALTEAFGMPAVPQRIEDLLHQRVRDALNELKRGGPHAENYRIQALAGLLASRVLGIKLPRTRDGDSYYRIYDLLMLGRGQRVEFGSACDEMDD